MLRARWVVGWVLGMGFSGCGVSPTEPHIVDQLVGEWFWLDAKGGIAEVTLTPESEGYDQSLRFLESGEVELFRDGVPQARTEFAYFVGDDGGSDNIEYGEGPFGFPSSGVEFIAGDTLLLIDPCCDGFVRRWIRFPPGDFTQTFASARQRAAPSARQPPRSRPRPASAVDQAAN